ncbi:MAG: thiamine pyrophosphate-dependent enzyme, partial [Nitrososphaerales archaeon]|nr:thiamine pyrophosphate-dependent enzyme [Nitrososphaerales archaeon]
MTHMIKCLTKEGEILKDVDIDLSESELIKAYQTMVLTRTLDTKMVALQRQGRIGFYLPSYGEEACSVGSALGVSNNDWFFPAYREQGAMLLKGVTLNFIISHLRGSAEDEHKGRSLTGLFGCSSKRFVPRSA